jgi:hypothetical protein
MRADLAGIFPRSESAPYEVTSPEDIKYNCSRGLLARRRFAANGGLRLHPSIIGPWSPVRKQLRVSSRHSANLATWFATPANSNQVMRGWQSTLTKLGTPTHMARQLTSGRWTSKLGELEDIEHLTLEQLSGSDYGQAVQFLKRKLPT